MRRGLSMSSAEVKAHNRKHGFEGPLERPESPVAAQKPIRGSRQPNLTEREYELILKSKFPGALIRFEVYTLKLAEGCRYVPDFAVEHLDGRLEFHEVKGAFIFSKALTKPKTAAELFPQRFVLAQKLKGGWEITPLKGRADRA